VVNAVAQRTSPALDALGRALQAGYSMHEIANEPELASVRSDPGYAVLAARFSR
jgi:hypothetical protein